MFVHFEQVLVMPLPSPKEVCAVKCMWLFHKETNKTQKEGVYLEVLTDKKIP
jgi:hypothetical protein